MRKNISILFFILLFSACSKPFDFERKKYEREVEQLKVSIDYPSASGVNSKAFNEMIQAVMKKNIKLFKADIDNYKYYGQRVLNGYYEIIKREEDYIYIQYQFEGIIPMASKYSRNYFEELEFDIKNGKQIIKDRDFNGVRLKRKEND